MKNLLFRYLLGMIPVIALFSNANAQAFKFSKELVAGFSNRDIAFTRANSEETVVYTSKPTEISSKAMKDFSKNFKSADNSIWSEIKDGFVATFKKDNVETRAYYDKKGKWTSTLKTYGESGMNRDIRKSVKSIYFDYKIYLVHEVTVGEQTAYLIKMEDEKSYKTIRIIDGEMDVYESYVKN